MNQLDYAIRSAIEYAVLQMVEKGEEQKLWKYKKGEKEMKKIITFIMLMFISLSVYANDIYVTPIWC